MDAAWLQRRRVSLCGGETDAAFQRELRACVPPPAILFADVEQGCRQDAAALRLWRAATDERLRGGGGSRCCAATLVRLAERLDRIGTAPVARHYYDVPGCYVRARIGELHAEALYHALVFPADGDGRGDNTVPQLRLASLYTRSLRRASDARNFGRGGGGGGGPVPSPSSLERRLVRAALCLLTDAAGRATAVDASQAAASQLETFERVFRTPEYWGSLGDADSSSSSSSSDTEDVPSRRRVRSARGSAALCGHLLRGTNAALAARHFARLRLFAAAAEAKRHREQRRRPLAAAAADVAQREAEARSEVAEDEAAAATFLLSQERLFGSMLRILKRRGFDPHRTDPGLQAVVPLAEAAAASAEEARLRTADEAACLSSLLRDVLRASREREAAILFGAATAATPPAAPPLPPPAQPAAASAARVAAAFAPHAVAAGGASESAVVALLERESIARVICLSGEAKCRRQLRHTLAALRVLAGDSGGGGGVCGGGRPQPPSQVPLGGDRFPERAQQQRQRVPAAYPVWGGVVAA